MISVEDCVNIEVGSLYKYVEASKEKLLIPVKNENILDKREEKERIRLGRLNSYSEKALHRQFVRDTKNIRDSESWKMLKRGTMKKDTEGLLTAAKDQAFLTN